MVAASLQALRVGGAGAWWQDTPLVALAPDEALFIEAQRLGQLGERYAQLQAQFAELLARFERLTAPTATSPPTAARRSSRAVKAAPASRTPRAPVARNGQTLPKPQQQILNALAAFAAAGVIAVERANAAVWAGQSPRSSGFTIIWGPCARSG